MLALQLCPDFPTYTDVVVFTTKLCRRWKVRSADIDDVVQETWVEILGSVHGYRLEKGTVEQWAHGVARNVIRKYKAKRKRYDDHFCACPLNEHECPSPDPSPEFCAERQQDRCIVSREADKLTENQRTVVKSHYGDDMSHREIAEKYGLTEGGSQKCLQRAINRLSKCYAAIARCVIVMPRDGIGCNDPSLRNHNATSQWIDSGKWAHYSGQIAAAILACALLWSSKPSVDPHAAITGEIRTGDGHAMYREDNRFFTFGKLSVCPKPPMGKLEPAPLPSVPAVTAPTVTHGKRADVWLPSPLPPFKPADSTSAHPPLGE